MSASNDRLPATASMSKTQTHVTNEKNTTAQNFSSILKTKFRIGTWNVRSMEHANLNTVISETYRNKIDILGITEHRWAKEGHFTTEDGGRMHFSGNEKKGQGGVGLWISKNKTGAILGYNPVNGRIMSIRLRGANKNLKIIQIYAPTSKAKKEEIELFYTDLQKEIDNTDRNDVLIVMGDFNAKVGSLQSETERGIIGQHAYGGRNKNGQELVDFSISNKLKIMNTNFPVHPRRLYTWTEPDGKTKHQIDYITIQNEHSELIRGARTLPGADCGSDHELLMAEMKWKLRCKKKQTPTIRYDVKDISENYSIAIKNRFSALAKLAEEREPEELANDIKSILTEEAAIHLNKQRKRKQPWISTETLEKIDYRKQLKPQKHEENGARAYKTTHKEIKRLCKRDKNSFFESKCNKIENLMKENKSREMFEEIKNLTRKQTPKLKVINDANGKTLIEDEDIAKRWAEYCSSMYKREDDEEECIINVNDCEETLPPLRTEVEQAIKMLKKNKSPGHDQIYAEMIMAGGEEAIDVYHLLINRIWTTEKWPLDWKTSIYVPIPKKGDLKTCSNYRTIALISHASKILLNIIMNRLTNKIQEEVSDNQAGFRKNRGTRDHLLNLATLIQKHNDMNKDLRICFIDYSKAFDCVSHNKLWQTLIDMNFEPKLIALLKSLYNEQKAMVRLESMTTESFEVGKGVRQGCILSPHLFSLYTEDIMRKVEEDDRKDLYDEVKINGQKIRDLRYADDTALMSTTAEGLKNLMKATKEHSEAKHLRLNIKKTKIMDSDKCEIKTKIEIDNETIENVDSFDYLGATFQGDGSSRKEIRKRIAIAKQKLKNMNKLWTGLETKLKLQILKTCIFPIALYGCEAWTLQQNDIEKLKAFEMYCYRRIFNISWKQKITNKSIMKKLDIKGSQILKHAKNQKLKYFGHIKRHSTLERVIMEGKVDGKRKPGRPRRQWKDDIGSWLGMSTAEAGRAAGKREDYRACVWAATSQSKGEIDQDTEDTPEW